MIGRISMLPGSLNLRMDPFEVPSDLVVHNEKL